MSKIIQMFPDKEYLVWLIDEMLEELKAKIFFEVDNTVYNANYLFVVLNKNGNKTRVLHSDCEFESDDDFLNFLMHAKICCSGVGSWGTINVPLMAIVSCYISYLNGSNNRIIFNGKTKSTCEVVINSELSDIVTEIFKFLLYYCENKKSLSDEEIYAKLTLLINFYIDYCDSNGVSK